jgi:heme exporter protein A
LQIFAQSIGKSFAEKRIFQYISFELSDGESLAIIGPNGAGKTTLIRILCGLIRPSEGILTYSDNDKIMAWPDLYQRIGLVGPYLELYEELTARENLDFFAKIRNLERAENGIKELMSRFLLAGRENDAVKEYSSGMLQRLKYVFALMAKPKILFLDEPTSNLDQQGIDTVYEIMREQKRNGLLVIATNDPADLKYGDTHIEINA